MKLYIGNLPKDFDEEELIEMFSEYGAVKSAKIIRDKQTKMSRGFGFVEIENKEAALKAIEDWDQGTIDDRIIKVNESKPKKKKRKKN